MGELKQTDKYGGKAKMSSGVDPKKKGQQGPIGPKGEGLHQPKTPKQFQDKPDQPISGTEGS